MNAVVLFLCLYKFFYWQPTLLVWSLLILCGVVVAAAEQVCKYVSDYGVYGFVLFVGTEAFIFFTLLFMVCILSDGSLSLCSWGESPLLASVFLVGSSCTVTAFHFDFGVGYSWLFLDLTSGLALLFVLFQLSEFYHCGSDVLSSAYFSACYCVVGLHCLHVVLGMLLMWVFYFKGLLFRAQYASFLVWYWHFVDLIWLFVYVGVYVV